MKMTNMFIYAVVAAVVLLIVTGGFVSMTTGEEPSTGALVGGTVVGAALGAAGSFLESDTPAIRSISKMIGGGEIQTMKVGLPAF